MNFLADVVGAGFKGALIRFFRLIFFAIIVIIVIYVVGIFTNKKASALVAKTLTYQPNAIATNYKKGSYSFANGTTNHWFNIPLQNPYTKTNDYDLIAFRFDALNYYVQFTPNNGTSNGYIEGDINVISSPNQVDLTITLPDQNDHSVTVTGVIWDSSNTARICYFASDTPSYLFCPLNKGETVNRIGLYVTANYSDATIINFNYEINNSFYFYNYESTEIVNSNGVIVQQQQQTQQTITDSDTTTSQANSTNALSGIQTTMESKLKGTNELTQMVMAPLTILTNVSSASCTPIQWHIPLVNYDATIPCMSSIYSTHFSQILALFSTVITGVFAYRTVVKLVSTIKDSLDAENDKLEVLDL